LGEILKGIIWTIPAYLAVCFWIGMSPFFSIGVLYAQDFAAFDALRSALPIGVFCASAILFGGILVKLPRASYIPLWVTAFLLISAYFGRADIEAQRERITAEFAPDHYELSNGVVLRFHKDFEFNLHGQAIKDCVPYAWSYREMGWYKLPQNIAPNVLRRDWVKMCDLKRDHE